MKKKSEGQLYLELVAKIDAVVENKLIERRQWKDLALNISANMDGEKVKSSSTTTSKMEEAVVMCLMAEEAVVSEVKRLIAEKNAIVRTIEKLHSPMEYRVLHMRYIQYMELEDIATKLKRDYSWVTTTHGRAVKHVQDLLDKGE